MDLRGYVLVNEDRERVYNYYTHLNVDQLIEIGFNNIITIDGK